MAFRYTFARGVMVIAVVLCAKSAQAHSEEGTRANQIPPKLQVLLGTQAVLHAVDMITTAYGLQLGGIEANPLLAPFSQRPVALASVSGAINLLQIYTIAQLHRRHPKVAVAWAVVLVGAEAFAVANNVRAAGQLQRARAGTR